MFFVDSGSFVELGDDLLLFVFSFIPVTPHRTKDWERPDMHDGSVSAGMSTHFITVHV